MTRVQDPHNVEAEQAFLGSIIQDPPVISRGSRLVRPADFFVERHSLIFQSMLDLDKAETPIDPVTLSEQLGQQLPDVGGIAYLIELRQDAPWSGSIDHYAAIIRKYARLRRLINGCARIVRLAQRASLNATVAGEALALAEQTLLALVKEQRLYSVRPLGDLLTAYFDKVETYPGSFSLATGLATLDALCGGWQPGELVYLAGEPGTLKTTLVLRLLRSLAGRKAALFSLESSNLAVVQRLLAAETSVRPDLLRTGDIERDLPALRSAGSRLAELGLYVDDTPGLLLSELRSKARWLHYLWGLDLIVVNYLQLLRSDQKHESRAEELTAISRALKALARELRLPLLAVFRCDPAADNRAATAGSAEADIIWWCQRSCDHLILTQTRWRDGPEGAAFELIYDPVRQEFSEPAKEAYGSIQTIQSRTKPRKHQRRMADPAANSPGAGTV
ncbi:MAG: AAA family ATPase [Anaerolineales bacterium]|nr:AAA family ATPase [Anaerolineales bacterium]